MVNSRIGILGYHEGSTGMGDKNVGQSGHNPGTIRQFRNQRCDVADLPASGLYSQVFLKPLRHSINQP